MSVSRGGLGGGNEYVDFDHVYHRSTIRDNGAGIDQATTIADLAEYEPANGIQRTEMAELVALKVHTFRGETDEATVASAPDAGRIHFEVSRDEDPGPITDNRNQVDLSNNAFEGDQPSSSALSRQIVDDDNDVLWFGGIRWDTTGNGRSQPLGQDHLMKYRDWFGLGPMFDPGDDLHVHARYNLVNHDSNWVGDISFSTYWYVTEREGRR